MDKQINIIRVMKMTGLSRTTVYKWSNDGCFPAYVEGYNRRNQRTFYWSLNEVTKWVEEERAKTPPV